MDDDGDAVTFGLETGQELGVQLIGNKLTWANPILGQHSIAVFAVDSFGLGEVQSISLAVTATGSTNHPAKFTSQPSGPAVVGEEWTYTLTATDEDAGDQVTFENLTDNVANRPQLTELNGVWTIRWTPTEEGVQTIRVRVRDLQNAGEIQSFDLPAVAPVDDPTEPYLLINSTPVRVVEAGSTYSYAVNAAYTDQHAADLIYQLVGGPPGMAMTSTGIISWLPNRVGTADVLVRVADANDETQFAKQFFTIRVDVATGNHAPVFDSRPGNFVVLDREWTYQLTASDADGDALEFELTEKPTGMILDGSLIRWTPKEEGEKAFTVYVHDGRGGVDGQRIKLPVNINQPPAFVSEPVTRVAPGQAYRYVVAVRDPDGDAVQVTLDAESRQRGLRLVNGVLTWTPTAHGTFPVVLTADDGLRQVTQRFEIVVATNHAPVFALDEPPDAYRDNLWQFALSATDADGDAVTFELVPHQTPSGLELVALQTGQTPYLLQWTPPAGTPSSVTITVAAIDSQGARTETTLTIDVLDPALANNRPPAVTSVPVGPAYIGHLWEYELLASDPDNDPLTVTFLSAPLGMTVTTEVVGGVTKRFVRWTPAESGNYKVQILVDDEALVFSHGFELPVTTKNVPPKVISVPFDPIIVGSTWRYQVLADDPDGDRLTVKISSESSGFSLDEHHVVSWTPTSADARPAPHLLTVIVSDGQGGEWQEDIALEVKLPRIDLVPHAPVLTTLPSGAIYYGHTWRFALEGFDPNGDSRAITFAVSHQNTVPDLHFVEDTNVLEVDASSIQLHHVGQVFTLGISLQDDGQGDQPAGAQTTFFTMPLRVLAFNHAPQIGVTAANQPQPGYVGETWTYQVPATDPDGDALIYELDANSVAAGLSIDANGFVTWTPNASGSRTVVVTVRDGELPAPHEGTSFDPNAPGAFRVGMQARMAFQLTIGDARPAIGQPRIVSLPPITARRNRSFTSTVTVENAPTTGLTFERFVESGWVNPDVGHSGDELVIDAQTGAITWRPTKLGHFDVGIALRLNGQIVDRQIFKLSVVDPFKLDEPPDITTSELPGPALRDVVYDARIEAYEPNGDAVTFAVTSGNLPTGLALSNMGRLTGTPTKAGSYSFTVRASDGYFTGDATYTLVVLQNAPPRITSSPSNTRATIGSSYSYAITASDPNAEDAIVFLLEQAPAGVSLTSVTVDAQGVHHLQLQWTPTESQRGRHRIVLVAANPGDPASEVRQSFDLQAVLAGVNAVPVIQNEPRTTIPAGYRFQHQVFATDLDGDPLTYRLLEGPAGLVLDNQGRMEWTPRQSQIAATPYTIRLRVSDGQGGVVEETYALVVTKQLVNDPPVITTTPRRSATTGYGYVYQAAADDFDRDLLLWSLTKGPDGLQIDPLTGRVTWTPTTKQLPGSYEVSLKVQDPYGGMATQTYTITLRGANLPPRFTSWPDNLAARGRLWTYAAQAVDGDEGTLTYRLVGETHGATIDAATGLVSWTPRVTGATGLYRLTVGVADDRQASTEQTFDIRVYDPATNTPPKYVSTPPKFAASQLVYRYVVEAIDDDGDPISFSLQNPLAGMTLSTAGQPAGKAEITWTPDRPDFPPGDYSFTVVASDGILHRRQHVTVTVRDNVAPVWQTLNDITLTAGTKLDLELPVTDADADLLTFTLAMTDGSSVPTGLSVVKGRLVWRTVPTDARVTPYGLTITATDGFVAAVKTVQLTVQADTAAPSLTLSAAPSNQVQIHRPVKLRVTSSDNVGLTSLSLVLVSRTTNQVTVPLHRPLELSTSGTVELTFDELGDYLVEARASDAAGHTTTQTLTLTVQDLVDGLPPIVGFRAPTQNGQVITEPLNVLALIQDPEHNLRSWQLVAQSQDGGETLQIASRTAAPGAFLADVDGSLGLFDTTLIANGAWTLRLTATDAAGNTTIVERTVEVKGNLKLGNFALSFSDLQIAAPGLPLQLSRTYNSLNANRSLDFGYGWSLDVGTPKVEVVYSDPRSGLLNNYTPFRDGTRVVITLSDGTVYGFTFYAVKLTDHWGTTLGQTRFEMVFVPDAGNTAYLGFDEEFLLYRPTDAIDEYYVDGGSIEYAFNPTEAFTKYDFVLYLPNGAKYGMESNPVLNGARTWIEDRNGNRVTYHKDGILHSNGREIVYHRDASNRIALVYVKGDEVLPDQTLPRGIKYLYDGDGNLSQVIDRSGKAVTYTYLDETDPNYRLHYLEQITDALGRPLTHAEYTPEGRVLRTTDSAGKSTSYSYQAGQRTQSISTPDGNTARFTADARGNVIEEETVAGTVLRSYNKEGQVVRETRVIGDLDVAGAFQDDLTTTFSYNQFGVPTFQKDPRGNASTITPDKYGNPLTIVDPLGNVVNNVYDAKGNLIRTTAAGRTTTFEYDLRGNVAKVLDDQGHTVVQNAYDTFGQLASTTDAFGNISRFTYDIFGRQKTAGRELRDAQNQLLTLETRTVYDDAGRVIGSTQWLVRAGQPPDQLWETETIYDAAGQVVRTIDRHGLVTETRYDSRGQVVEVRSEALDSAGVLTTFLQRTLYDDFGRVVYSTDRFRLGTTELISGTHTLYDTVGRVSRTDRVRGLEITVAETGPLSGIYAATLGSTANLSVLSSSLATYDADGRLIASSDNHGLRSLTKYNRYGDTIETLSEAINEHGQHVWFVSRTVYDGKGRAFLSLDAYQLAAGANNAPPTNTDTPVGGVFGTRTLYDSQGRAYRTERLAGVGVTYDADRRDLSISHAGSLISFSETKYDAQGRVTRSIGNDGRVTDFEYDSYGRRVATLDQAVSIDGSLVRLRSETVYDATGRVSEERSGLRQVVNTSGQTLSIDDTRVRRTLFTYDTFGNVVQTVIRDKQGTLLADSRATFDLQGRKLTESEWVDGLANAQVFSTKSFEYDDQGRLTATVLPAVVTGQAPPRYQYAYNAQGQQTLLVDPLGRETHWTFDEQGRQLTRTLPLGFGSDGLLTNGETPTGDWTERFEYDDMGRQTLAVSFEGVVTQSVYDPVTGRLVEQRFFDNLTLYNAGQGTPTETVVSLYDAHGRRIAAIRHQGAATGSVLRDELWVYDAQGRLFATVNPEGIVAYGYDQLGRQIRTVTAAPPTDIAATASSLALNPQLSTLNLLTDTRSTYDAFGRLATVTVYARDGASLPENQRETTRYEYDLEGRLHRLTLPNGVIADHAYDVLGRLTRLTHYAPDSTPDDLSNNARIDEFRYASRADGKWVQVDEDLWINASAATPISFQLDYEYDSLGRLITETRDGAGTADDFRTVYTFDLVSNRIGKTVDLERDGDIDETTTSVYDANDRLDTESTTRAGGVSPLLTDYDYNHTQQTGKTISTAGVIQSQTTFAYDLRGRMVHVSVTADGQTKVTLYRYDDAGTRTAVVNQADGSMTTYLVDYQNPTGYSQTLVESTTDADGDLVQRVSYVVGLDQISQTTTTYDPTQPQSPATGSETLVFQSDGHGSVRVLGDFAAAVVQAFAYDAYGTLLTIWNGQGVVSGGPGQPAEASLARTSYLYSGEAFDNRTGLQNLRARWYDPATGRFTSLDPFFGRQSDPLSFHKYGFGYADPINNSDPTGWDPNLPGLGVVNAFGAGIRAFATHEVRKVAARAVAGFVLGVGVNALRNHALGMEWHDGWLEAGFSGAVFVNMAARLPALAAVLAVYGVADAMAVALTVYQDPSSTTDEYAAAGAYLVLNAFLFGANTSNMGGSAAPALSARGAALLSWGQRAFSGLLSGESIFGARVNNLFGWRMSEARAMPVRDVGGTKVYGQGLRSSSRTPNHGEGIEALAENGGRSGLYKAIWMQRGVRNAVNSLSGGVRSIPDWIGLRWDGKIDLIEVRSNTDSTDVLQLRLQRIRQGLDEQYRGRIRVLEPDDAVTWSDFANFGT